MKIIESLDFKLFEQKMSKLDHNSLLLNLKSNWDLFRINVNNVYMSSYIDFITKIRSDYCKYLSTILYSSNLHFYYHFLSIIEHNLINIDINQKSLIYIDFVLNPYVYQMSMTKKFISKSNKKIILRLHLDLTLKNTVLCKLEDDDT